MSGSNTTTHAAATGASAAKRVARRLLGVVIVVVGVTFLAFFLSYLSPTDAATRYFTDHGVSPSPAELEAKRHELGLDRPFIEQYVSWIGDLFRGDLGESYRSGRSVSGSLIGCLPYTLALTGTSMLLTLAIALPLGLLCAYRKDGVVDNIVRAATYLFCSLPTFFVALILLYVLSVQFHLFPVRSTPDLQGIVMPTLAMALPLSAWYVRQVRTIALEQLDAGYVDGLRSRGISERQILFKHVLRNSLVPILALVGISIGSLLGGTAIIESIFNWPGVGNLSVAAINARDYPVVQGYTLLMAIVYLVVNFLIDVAYRVVDPRIGRESA
ncbi:MAG: ABC transporter permease [Coriobacteriaceae bacterium]|nr:ABC transporter permease [Coriobacteriaceae bacterium]